MHAEKIADVPTLYAEGADYVTVPRLLEATNLLSVLEAAESDLLDLKRGEQEELLKARDEVIP